jgi:diaminohydroxyphosphoribosylaminopyrimidine deaminase/5-amino-6-(5-phosphoribosylamino)uracil reductase
MAATGRKTQSPKPKVQSPRASGPAIIAFRMHQPSDAAWPLIRAAAEAASRLDDIGADTRFTFTSARQLASVDAPATASLEWKAGTGWRSLLSQDHPFQSAFDLYLPMCSATAARPIAVGHLGQSLDAFIATHSGDSQFVTGSANIVHLHRMRALTDAVIVGSGTVVADNPQLTTRHVEGANPLRVVFDPARRVGLEPKYRVFTDTETPTLYFCARDLIRKGETHFGVAEIVSIDADDPRSDAALTRVFANLRMRGCPRIFVEGGGVTVSAFLQAGLLDRLHVAIAPLIIGDGRPAIRLAPQQKLRDCRRPQYRVFRMGGDMLFDCDLHSEAPESDDQQLTRII